MGLKKCKDCKSVMNTKAEYCPICGGALGKRRGALTYIGALIIILSVLAAIDSFMETGEKSGSTPATKEVYNEGDTVHVGYMSYSVWRSWWSLELSNNQFLNEQPNAMFLFVELTARNDDRKARVIPLFKLIDENGAEYETSSKDWAVEGSIGVLETLNPGVQKQGLIVFDVPMNHTYKLKVSGGYWSSEDALIRLNPKQGRYSD